MKNKQWKYLKRYMVFFVSFILAISVSACGSHAKDSGQKQEKTSKKETHKEVTDAALEEAEAAFELENPRIEAVTDLKSGQKVTWDCVWFGSYPQSEVTAEDSIYKKLQASQEWDSEDCLTIDGVKYKRIKKENAVYVNSYVEGNNSSFYYHWDDEYHYFKYEPIKWRVLSTDGEKAFLLADQILDDHRYHDADAPVTWETSTIRSWLNGYGDYVGELMAGFLNRTFSTKEQEAILDTALDNQPNFSRGTDSGSATTDKIFLLSESEIYGAALSYGFVTNANIPDEARTAKGTDYARAMGISNYGGAGRSMWWLRTAGSAQNYAAYINDNGSVNLGGYYVNQSDAGVRPALYLDLSDDTVYQNAGTVASNGLILEPDAD